jgi:uncharacterized protein (TIGR02996 family)
MILASPAARGLFQAILADPRDDVPRLLLADVLEDSGEVERAEFIRLQITLAKMPSGAVIGRAALRRRERELFAEAYPALASGLPGAPVDYLVEGLSCRRRFGDRTAIFTFRRGFVASVALTLADWCGATCRSCAGSGEDQRESTSGDCPHCHGTGKTGGYGPALVLAAPIEEVIISEPKPRQWLRNLWWYDHLPEVLAPYLDRQTGPHNATEEAARAALNRAALTQARQEAGLPALA